MATVSSAATVERSGVSTFKSRRSFQERWLSPALLFTLIIAIFVFVYGFIGFTFYTSISNWKTNKRDLTISDPWYKTYDTLFHQSRFQIDLRNTFVFTVLFLILSIVAGLALALLLDRHVMGSGLFEHLSLPVCDRTRLSRPAWSGDGYLIRKPASKCAFPTIGSQLCPGKGRGRSAQTGMDHRSGRGLAGERRAGEDNSLGRWVERQTRNPIGDDPDRDRRYLATIRFRHGYVPGRAGHDPGEVKEAALIDGASDWRAYRDIIIPLLKPITISTMIILGHVSLKIFDLIYAMSGKGPGFATDVPGIFVYDKMFGAQQYNLGSAASIVMLVLVSIVIVPYLWRQLKESVTMAVDLHRHSRRPATTATQVGDRVIFVVLVLTALFYIAPVYVMIANGLKEKS